MDDSVMRTRLKGCLHPATRNSITRHHQRERQRLVFAGMDPETRIRPRICVSTVFRLRLSSAYDVAEFSSVPCGISKGDWTEAMRNAVHHVNGWHWVKDGRGRC